MPTTTDATLWPIPIGTDDPDVVDDMTKLAKAIEKNVIGVYNNTGDRDTKTNAAGRVDGMFAITRDTHTVWYWNAGIPDWVQFPPASPTIRSGTGAPSNATGVDGDVYFRY